MTVCCSKMKEDTNLCRICLKCLSTDTKYHKLKDLEENVLECLTEIDLTIPDNPLACEECLASIRSLYQFKQTCLATERLVQDLRSRSIPFEDALKYVDIDRVKLEGEHLEVVDFNDVDFNTEIPMVLKNNNAVASYTCFTCSSTFNNRRGLLLHLNSHKEKCNYITPNNSILNGRKKVHSELQLYKCDHCKYRTNKKHKLKVHLQKHTSEKPLKHLKSHKKKSTRSNSTLNGRKKVHSELRPHKCNYCEYRSKTKHHLSVHLRKHTGEKPFVCDLCEYKSARKDSYKLHRMKHLKERLFYCNDCNFGTNYKSTLANHVLIHLKEKPFSCDKCKATFSMKTNMKRHILAVHYKAALEKRHKCDRCEYKTDIAYNLRVHLRTHTGEKPYRCNVCDYSFSLKINLQVHMRVHTGEKNYKCDKCSYSCTQSGTLKLHKKRHLSIPVLKCDRCDFKTLNYFNMKNHKC